MISRRDALKTLATSLGSASVWPCISDSGAQAFAEIQAANAAPRPVFLTSAQYATVDALAETIIPADDHSPGARAARVADYIDLLLSESDRNVQRQWIEGLEALEKESTRRFKTPFASLNSDQAVALLTDISRNELTPKSRLEQFFVRTKDATLRGYYTSEIGIHKELEYKGNTYLQEFVGCNHPEHGYVEGK